MQAILTVVTAVLLAGCGVVTYRAAPVRGRLEVRLVARPGAPGGERVRRFFGHETLRLERAVILGSSEVREVHLEDAPDGHRYVVLHLTDTGRRRLADATGRHLGRRLAILVGGRVVVAPTIRTPIDEGIAHISVGDEGQIEQVFEALTQGGEDSGEESDSAPTPEPAPASNTEVAPAPASDTEVAPAPASDSAPAPEPAPASDAEVAPGSEPSPGQEPALAPVSSGAARGLTTLGA